MCVMATWEKNKGFFFVSVYCGNFELNLLLAAYILQQVCQEDILIPHFEEVHILCELLQLTALL